MSSLTRLILLVLCGAYMLGCTPPSAGFKTTEIGPVDWGGEFVLTDQRGKPFSSKALSGKVVVIFFGFSHCPDICSPTLVRLAKLRRRLADDAAAMQVVFITVDPEHDTPEQLKQFLSQFDSSFIGLTGNTQQIEAVIKEYKIAVDQGTEGNAATISHTGGVFVKDKSGRLRLYMAEDVGIDVMAHDLRRLLREG